MMCDQTTNTVTQIKSGKIKGYAVTTKERLPVLPDLPTLDEFGLDGFEMTVWHGLYAPAGTPQEILDKLAAALQVALQDPKVIERFAQLGTVPVPLDEATPAALDAAPQGRGRQVEADHPGRRHLRRLNRNQGSAPCRQHHSTMPGSAARDVRCGRRGSAPRPDRASAPAGATQRAHHRPRRRQGLGRDGQGGRGPLAGAARGARGHPLRPRRALRADRDRRGGASGPGCRRAGRGGTDPGTRRGRRPGRSGPVPDLRRRLVPAGAAGPGADARRQAGGEQGAARQRCGHRPDEHGPPSSLRDQGRQARRRGAPGEGREPADLRRARRRPGGDRVGADHRRPQHLRRRPGGAGALSASSRRKRSAATWPRPARRRPSPATRGWPGSRT